MPNQSEGHVGRVPIAIRGKFKDELDSLCKQKVLTKLDKNEVTEWLNSFVNVDKEDTSLRVCLDPSGLNPYIIRPVFNSYTLDEISYMLKDAKVFTVCDANKGFLSGSSSRRVQETHCYAHSLGSLCPQCFGHGLIISFRCI